MSLKKIVPMSLLLGNCIVAGVMGYGWLHFGSLSRFSEGLQGVNHLISETEVDLGAVAVNASRTLTIRFVNTNNSPTRVLGLQATCRVQPIDPLPFMLQPAEVHDFRVKITAPSNGAINATLNFHTNSPVLPKEQLKIISQLSTSS